MSRNAMQPLDSKRQVGLLFHIIHEPAEPIRAGYYQQKLLLKCFAVQDDVLQRANLAPDYRAIFWRVMKIKGYRILVAPGV